MKKGISLIVLVITIIVMIIIAGAIIISLNSSNIINQSNTAVEESNEANARSVLAVKYAEILAVHYASNPTITYDASKDPTTGMKVDNEVVTDLEYLQDAVESLTDDNEGWSVKVSGKGYDLEEK